jgi:uncharacterized membrane protein YccC
MPTDLSALPMWKGLFNEDWLEANWVPLTHAARGAVAFALLFFSWRWLEMDNIAGSAGTCCVVLMLPGGAIRQGEDAALRDRGVQRFVGCVLGGLVGLGMLLAIGDRFQLWLLVLSAGLWIAAWVQNGSPGASYAGSQFAVALGVTLIQSNGPPTSMLPPWQRFCGILLGVVILGLLQTVWKIPEPEPSLQRDEQQRRLV